MKDLEQIKRDNEQRMREASERLVKDHGRDDIKVLPGIVSRDVVVLMQGNETVIVPIAHIEQVCRAMWEVARAD